MNGHVCECEISPQKEAATYRTLIGVPIVDDELHRVGVFHHALDKLVLGDHVVERFVLDLLTRAGLRIRVRCTHRQTKSWANLTRARAHNLSHTNTARTSIWSTRDVLPSRAAFIAAIAAWALCRDDDMMQTRGQRFWTCFFGGKAELGSPSLTHSMLGLPNQRNRQIRAGFYCSLTARGSVLISEPEERLACHTPFLCKCHSNSLVWWQSCSYIVTNSSRAKIKKLGLDPMANSTKNKIVVKTLNKRSFIPPRNSNKNRT